MTESLTRNAARNLNVGGKYVSAKLLTTSVVAAFAELTGAADVPVSIFMGDLPTRKRLGASLRVETSRRFLSFDCESTETNCSHGTDGCPDVYELLVNGRTRETSFDVRQSPFSAYVYSCIGDGGLERIMSSVHIYPMTKETATELLASLPPAAIKYVGENMANLAVSRKDAILSVLQSLSALQQAED